MSDYTMDLEAAYKKIHELECLCRSFEQLNRSLEIDEVLKNTLKNATELMEAETGSLALVDEADQCLRFVESTDTNFDKLKKFTVPLGEGIAGHVAVTGIPVRLDDVHQDKRFYGKIDQKLGHMTTSYLCVPLVVNDTIIGTAQIMNRLDGKVFSKSDEELLQGFAKQAALAIKNAKLHQIMLKQKEIDLELKICSQIQKKIFPKNFLETDHFEIYGSSISCREVGGDYFTFILRADGSRDIMIGDVSGKGISAALMVSELHTAIHMLSQTNFTITDMINKLNNHLVESLLSGKFITLFAARLSPDETILNYVLAGHPPPFLFKADGSVQNLNYGGMALGISPDIEIEGGELKMEPGDLLFSFTDGYSEARNSQGIFFEEERLRDSLLQYVSENRSLAEMCEGLNQIIAEFSNNAAPMDDATLLLIRRK